MLLLNAGVGLIILYQRLRALEDKIKLSQSLIFSKNDGALTLIIIVLYPVVKFAVFINFYEFFYGAVLT